MPQIRPSLKSRSQIFDSPGRASFGELVHSVSTVECRKLIAAAVCENPRSRKQAFLQMLDLLGANPFVTPRGAEAKLNLAYNTVMRGIGLLQEQDLAAGRTPGLTEVQFCAALE